MASDNAGAGYDGAGVIRAGLRRARSPSREAELIAGGIIVLAGAFVYPYLERLVGPIMPGCLFHRVTGLPCLLCGMTRSLAATARGDLAEAFRMHLLGPPLLLVITAVTLLLAVEFAVSRRILPRPGKRAWKYISWGTLAVLAVAWVIRLVFLGVNV